MNAHAFNSYETENAVMGLQDLEAHSMTSSLKRLSCKVSDKMENSESETNKHA